MEITTAVNFKCGKKAGQGCKVYKVVDSEKC